MDSIFGLVTVLYRSAGVLDGFFESLAKLNSAFTLYVVDNNETDIDVTELLSASLKHGIDYKYVEHGVNRGVAKGNNLGVAMALEDRCKWIGIINNDIEFEDPELLNGLVNSALEQSVGVVVPQISYFGTNKVWFGGGVFRKYAAVTPHLRDLEERSSASDEIFVTGYAPTCFMLISAETMLTVGMFDEKYFVYFDDADWVYRYTEGGGKVLYNGKFLVAHKVSTSTGGVASKFSVFYSTRNRIYFARKNYSVIWWWIFLAFFIMRAPLRWLTLGKPLRETYANAISMGFKMRPDRSE